MHDLLDYQIQIQVKEIPAPPFRTAMSLGEFGVNWNGVRMILRVLETDLYLDVVCTGYMVFKCFQTCHFIM